MGGRVKVICLLPLVLFVDYRWNFAQTSVLIQIPGSAGRCQGKDLTLGTVSNWVLLLASIGVRLWNRHILDTHREWTINDINNRLSMRSKTKITWRSHTHKALIRNKAEWRINQITACYFLTTVIKCTMNRFLSILYVHVDIWSASWFPTIANHQRPVIINKKNLLGELVLWVYGFG